MKLPIPKPFPLSEVKLSPCAQHELVAAFRSVEPDFGADDTEVMNTLSPVLVSGLGALLSSPYWKRSEWFRTTKHHRFDAFTLRDGKTDKVLVQPAVVATFDGPKCLLQSTLEHSLYDLYEVDRVIEETKVEVGVL